MNSLFDKYEIIKTIDKDEYSSIYLAQEKGTENKFILKKVPLNTSGAIYDTVIKELKEMTSSSFKIDKASDSPTVINFFSEEGDNYFLFSFTSEKSLKRINFYPSMGQVLNNRYIIIKGVARGGFGTVYIAKDLSLPGKVWALKEMHSEDKLPEVMEKSFRIEAEMLSKLEHPGIPRISDFFIQSGRLYLVMDYVRGESLKSKLKALGKGNYFREETVVSWAISLCSVLSYLHNQPAPIIFRDLKPDNIMITPEGELKLIDFGIARLFQGEMAETTRYALLTAGYAPQEQWMGKAEPRSDIYSLGATLYHLLSGVHPKDAAPNFPPIEKYNPSINKSLSKIISKALEPKINERFRTIEDMKKELVNIEKEKEKKVTAGEHLKKAVEYENKGDYFQANFEYLKAMDTEKDNFAIYCSAGRCCEQLGFKDRALENYTKALDFDIDEEKKKEILSSMERLRAEIERDEETISAEKTVQVERAEKREEKKADRPSGKKKKSFFIPILMGIFLIFLLPAVLLMIFGYPYFSSLFNKNNGEDNFSHDEKHIPGVIYNKLSKEERKKLDKAFSLSMEGDYEEALSICDDILKNNPKNSGALYEKGIFLYELCNYKEALPCFSDSIKFAPEDFTEGYYWQGRTLFELGRNDDALEAYARAIELDPKFLPPRSFKGLAFYYEAEYEKAIECYDRAIEIDPKFAEGWTGKGDALFALGENEEAIECYDKAINCNDTYIDAWKGKGEVLHYGKKYDEAIECFNRAIELDPYYVGLLHSKAWSLEKKGDYREAIKVYKKALDIDPEYSATFQAMGWTYVAMEEYEKAIECYDRALELDRDCTFTWDYKGVALTGLGRYEEAIECFDRALKLDPENMVAENNKEHALSLMGENKSFDMEILKNATYSLSGYDDQKITLSNGAYSEEYLYVWIEEEPIAFGDINNDNREDAAVILVYSGGGTGLFFEAALVLNQDGKPVHIASTELGDRIIVEDLNIEPGHINVDILTHGPDQAMADLPEVAKHFTFELIGNRLIRR